jgi:tetratricopeptide (TPR) repeat protein/predicted Ser/Thr protein kinase
MLRPGGAGVESSNTNVVTRVVEPSSSAVGLEHTGQDDEQPTPPLAVTQLAQGTAFGRYIVVRKLGHGGMGVVYLAYDPQLDRGVALKVLRPGARSADRGRAQDRLLREAQAMARLSHPNVVPVYDAGTVQGHVFLAMEYVDGRTLGEWLRHAQPAWAQVLDAMVGAGRGLAAAHEAGLVHRDFKPDNVMIDAQGRPRVMDFGLARAADDDGGASTQREALAGDPASSSPAFDAELSGASSSGLGSGSGSGLGSSAGMESLTRTGFVLGTPAYMAPEQHFGAAPDPASDQFSFCVALYEALYGERPFAGDTPAALVQAAKQRDVRPAPAGSRVPAWLRRVVLRGLCPEPQDRWPSLPALLDELAVRPRDASRVRAGVATLGLLGAVAGGSVWLQARAEDDPCGGGEAALASAWGDDRAQAVRAAFAGTELAFADQAAGRAIEGLDAWGAQWLEQHRDACEDTQVRREQSGTGLDLRMRCLQGRQRAMGALVEVLASADPGTVENAARAVAALPEPSFCADLEALAAEVPPPEDPAARQRVEELLAALERVDALMVAARFPEARAAFDEARAAAVDLEHAPLEVELGAREGRLLEAEAKLDDAVRVLEAALWRAEGLGMDRQAVSLATNLVWLDGAERNRHERGETWATLATAKLERLGDEPRLRAGLLRHRGDLADAQGHYDESARHYQAALALLEAAAPGSVGYLHALGDFGKTHYRAGRLAQAAQTFEQAAVVAAEVLGEWHPDVAKLRGNAASALHMVGEHAKARAAFEDVLRRLERAYGPDHLAVATVLTNLGNACYRTGDLDAAVAAARRAIRIKEAALGPGHPKVGMNLNNLAMALSRQGQHEEALDTYRRAETSMAQLGAEHVSLVEPRVGQGEELMHLSRHAEAIAPLERAYALEQAHGHDPRRRALPAFLLARALWDGAGDRARAQAVAADARAVLGQAPEAAEDRRLLEAVQAWQAAHPAAPG